MSKQREAMQFALETLEDIFGKHKIDVTAINMLREALAEPEPTTDGELYAAFLMGLQSKKPAKKPLTYEEVSAIVQSMSAYTWDIHMLARAVERAHGIGET